MKTDEKQMDADSKTNKYAVPALDKGLDIIEYLVSQELPRSQAEIAQGVGRNPNEIYRVLVGLEARGYLVRDELSGRYQLSLKLYNLSRSISPIDQLRQVALPQMEDLAVRIGQSCYLSMLYQSQTMVIVQARSQVPVSVNIAEGSLFPTMTTTSGKVLLANSNSEVQEMILQREKGFSKLTKASKNSLFEELDIIKQQGFLLADNSITDGICDVAVLIGKPEGKVVAALAVSVLKNKTHQTNSMLDIKNELLLTAEKIAQQLGC